MAVDKKISQLTSLAQVDVSASTDVLPIVDTSATETKKITVSALVGAGATAGISGAVLTNGTINSTTIGATTPSTGAFTTLSASSTVSGTGFSTYLASPPAIGSTAANTGAFTTLTTSSTVTLNGGTANGVLYLNGSKVATSGSALTFDGTTFTSGAHTLSTGNLTFSSTAQRITGDMSNATLASRLAFQTSTTNGNTTLNIIPNGTGTASQFVAHMGSDPANTSRAGININSTQSAALVFSDITGTGTYLPMTFYTGGSERMRLDTSGNLLVGTATSVGGVRLTSVGGGVQLSGGTTAQEGVRIQRATGYATFTGINNDNNAYNGLQFFTSASAAATIDTSGNVGIGTTSPVAGYRLNVVNDSGNAQQLIRAGTNFNSTIAFGDQDSSTSGQLIYAHNGDYMAFNTNAAERMRIDSSGNVGIGGTGEARTKVTVTGTLPTSSAQSFGFSLPGTIPSGTTGSAFGYTTGINTEAASFTLTTLRHFNASQATIGAGSTVTNQYGFFAQSNLTGATNNYGFYSDIASGSNRWNFYAAGTARNYFAGRTDVGNTRIEATNNWSGVKIYSETGVSLADGATVTLTSTVCGAVTINVYETASGDGGTFFANYSGTVTKLAGDGAATDTGSTFAVYKSAGSHTLTLKNKYGNTRGFRVSVIGAYVE